MSIYETQTRILQEYQALLHGFKDVSIRGAGTGWETGLYTAVLQDIRSTKDLPEFIDNIRELEQDGSEILQQTGNFEAANASWVKAIRICEIARTTFWCSTAPSRTGIVGKTLQSNTYLGNYRLYAERSAQLRRQRATNARSPSSISGTNLSPPVSLDSFGSFRKAAILQGAVAVRHRRYVFT